jgi:hypothetical protein
MSLADLDPLEAEKTETKLERQRFQNEVTAHEHPAFSWLSATPNYVPAVG